MPLACPKCRTEDLRAEKQGAVDVDRCPVCKGLFLDEGELEQLLAAHLGEAADTLAFSAMSDAMDVLPATCPRCSVAMRPETGPASIRVDRCPTCKATFLDQGELATLQLAEG